MFLSEKMNFRGLIVPMALASGLFGLVNVLQRIVFRETNFVSGYVFFTLGTCAGALLLLIPAQWRQEILKQSEEADPRSKFWYFVNRFIDGVGSFLIFYAISLTHPAIVDAISGVRFTIIFVSALLLTKFRPDWLSEVFSGRTLAIKTIATAIIVAGMVWLATHGGHEEAGAPTASSNPIRIGPNTNGPLYPRTDNPGDSRLQFRAPTISRIPEFVSAEAVLPFVTNSGQKLGLSRSGQQFSREACNLCALARCN